MLAISFSQCNYQKRSLITQYPDSQGLKEPKRKHFIDYLPKTRFIWVRDCIH